MKNRWNQWNEPLMGNEREVEAACEGLRRPKVRFLILEGAPQAGKTREAMQVAAELLEEFTDGAFFVTFASVTNPALVVPMVAEPLGVKEVDGQSLLESLEGYLRDKKLLLILGDWTYLQDETPLLIELLWACHNLKILVTTRKGLYRYDVGCEVFMPVGSWC